MLVPDSAGRPAEARAVFAKMPPSMARRVILFGERWAPLADKNGLRVVASGDLDALAQELGVLPEGATLRVLGAGEQTPIFRQLEERVAEMRIRLAPYPLRPGLEIFLMRLGQALGVPREMVAESLAALTRQFKELDIRA